jgi:hypothetical protein
MTRNPATRPGNPGRSLLKRNADYPFFSQIFAESSAEFRRALSVSQ